jgi:hypothetical protein
LSLDECVVETFDLSLVLLLRFLTSSAAALASAPAPAAVAISRVPVGLSALASVLLPVPSRKLSEGMAEISEALTLYVSEGISGLAGRLRLWLRSISISIGFLETLDSSVAEA